MQKKTPEIYVKISFSAKQSMNGMRLPEDGGGGEGSQQKD